MTINIQRNKKKAYDILIVMVEGNDKGMCIMNGREKRLSCGELYIVMAFFLFFLWLGWVVVTYSEINLSIYSLFIIWGIKLGIGGMFVEIK